MTDTVSQPGDAGAPPGGDAAGVRCPLCEYDLRGLTEPRCPECGYRFVWADVIDPSRRLHPYLFEHHPERNAGSFVRTHLGGWRPRTFWTSLQPAQPSRVRRLLLYAVLAWSPVLSVVAAHYAVWWRVSVESTRFERASWRAQWRPGSPYYQSVIAQFGSVERWLDAVEPEPPSREFFRRAWRAESGWALAIAVGFLAWPWATFLALLVFRISMRRARIKPVHVLRCVVYGFDVYVPVALAVGAAVLYRAMQTWTAFPPPASFTSRWVPTPPIPTVMPYSYRPDVVADMLCWMCMAALAAAAYRLTAAFRHYLKFDHPVATVLASQVIVALAAAVAALQWLMQ